MKCEPLPCKVFCSDVSLGRLSNLSCYLFRSFPFRTFIFSQCLWMTQIYTYLSNYISNSTCYLKPINKYRLIRLFDQLWKKIYSITCFKNKLNKDREVFRRTDFLSLTFDGKELCDVCVTLRKVYAEFRRLAMICGSGNSPRQ